MAEAELVPRARILDRERMRAECVADPNFDVVVIGGGITGAGTFRDLALQGLRVLLVERGDFASGASSALSRIAHGGFRYLERGEIGLVRDSVIERDRLLRNAPHALRPVRLVMPLSGWTGGLAAAPLRFLKLAPRGALPGLVPMALGGKLYDALAGGGHALPSSRLLTGGKFRRELPHLAGRYRGALTLGEARIVMPERIAVELIEDGVAAGSRSAAFNHCALVAVEGRTLRFSDGAGARFTVDARAVVNAGGAHADKIAGLFGIEERMTGGVAGVHLLLDAPALAKALGDDLLFFEDDHPDRARRRLLIAYRIGQGRILLGTTESRCDEPDEAAVLPSDEAYLLKSLGAALPQFALDDSAIVDRLVGVRPLVHSTSADLGGRSRDHAVFLHEGPVPVVTVVGGKWRTFRRMAEDATEAVLRRLGVARQVDTADLPIGGGRDFPRGGTEREERIDRLAIRGLGRELAGRLVETYGGRAPAVAESIVIHGDQAVLPHSPITRGEVAFFRASELALGDEDWFRRRSEAWIQATPADFPVRTE